MQANCYLNACKDHLTRKRFIVSMNEIWYSQKKRLLNLMLYLQVFERICFRTFTRCKISNIRQCCRSWVPWIIKILDRIDKDLGECQHTIIILVNQCWNWLQPETSYFIYGYCKKTNGSFVQHSWHHKDSIHIPLKLFITEELSELKILNDFLEVGLRSQTLFETLLLLVRFNGRQL